MGIFLNSNQQKTFYLFLSLYLISTYILIGTIAYNYYDTQKKWIHLEVHNELNKKADELAMSLSKKKNIDYAKLDLSDKNFNVEFINNESKKYPLKVFNTGVFDKNKLCMLATKVSIKNNNWGFVITDKTLTNTKKQLQNKVQIIFFIIIILVGVFAYILSKLFLKPINDHIDNLHNFIKDVNHELNTPITSLIMSSKQLSKKYDKKLINNITISTKQLYEIYKSLIEINFTSKDDNKSNVNLKDLLHSSLDYFTEILSSKNIEVKHTINDFVFLANQEKIQMVFNNLISNAIKYSNVNSKIEIYLENNIVTIKDYGVGIKKELQDKIFSRYYQANDSVRGFGIGLDITKRICKEYDIKIELESYENENTTFKLTF